MHHHLLVRHVHRVHVWRARARCDRRRRVGPDRVHSQRSESRTHGNGAHHRLPYRKHTSTAFHYLPPAVIPTSPLPCPASDAGSVTLICPTPAYVPCGPAYATV